MVCNILDGIGRRCSVFTETTTIPLPIYRGLAPQLSHPVDGRTAGGPRSSAALDGTVLATTSSAPYQHLGADHHHHAAMVSLHLHSSVVARCASHLHLPNVKTLDLTRDACLVGFVRSFRSFVR